MRIQLISSIHDVDRDAWDRLVGDDDPFVEHDFLSTLEDSGSVGFDSGWEPLHVTVWDGETLIGALPLYVKTHSYGEYIFDWAWADAAQRLGQPYYPKLVSMVPVTPVTGRRFLLLSDVGEAEVVRRLLDGCFEALAQTRASSIHLLFLTEQEQRWVDLDGRFQRRLSFQFHWQNEGYQGFDGFVDRFRSSMRKKLRKERRAIASNGLAIETLTGDDLDATHWTRFEALYRDTCARKGSYPYLTREFFELASDRLRKRAVLVRATQHGQLVAASLNFEKGAHLYGRYWGTTGYHDGLHFELCYYRLIERAIERQMTRFEAGAQGTHKLRRGLLPTLVYSSHWIGNPILSQAIAEFLPREAVAVQQQVEALRHHGPFKRGPAAQEPFGQSSDGSVAR